MKVINKGTYKVVKAILEMKKFTQYRISKDQHVAFSFVNKVVNWFVSCGYVARRKGYYEVVAAGAIFSLFPLYRKMKLHAVFDINLSKEEALNIIKDKGALCLTSVLSYYDSYYRDPAIYVYLKDDKIIEELKHSPKGFTHIEIYMEDLSSNDFVKKNNYLLTDKIRTIIDLFCANKAYAAERLIKKEWI